MGLCFLLWFSDLTALAVDAKAIRLADEAYVRGIAAYQSEKWADAVRELDLSYKAHAQGRTASVLASAYMMVNGPREALSFAQKALAAKPAINDDYKNKMKEIVQWAHQELNRSGGGNSTDEFDISGKADGFSLAKPKRPQPLVLGRLRRPPKMR